MNKFNIHSSTSYFNGSFVPFDEAKLSIASSPVLYGLSVYTVFSVNWNEKTKQHYIFRLEEHYERLVNSARIMDFQEFVNSWSYAKFEQTMLSLLKQNNMFENMLVRVTVYVDEIIAGTKIHGLKNNLNAYVYPAGEILPASGVHLGVSSWIRNMDNSIPAKAKINGSYVNASLMKNEAILNGYDDAIALDHNGHVAESTVANLFLVRGSKLVTPDTSTDILEGITRDTLLEIAPKLGIKKEERSIDRTELYKADEAFLCGSSVRVTPILSIDKRKIGDGKLGTITSKIIEEYNNIQLGNNESYRHWLKKIN